LVGGYARINKGDSKIGDVIFERTNLNSEFPAEVKNNAWNQVRPYKYIPVIGYNEKTGEWFVVPADVIMEWATTKMGQHTPNPFVCVNFGVPKSVTDIKRDETKWTPYLVQEKDLRSKIISAHKSAMSNTEMRDFAERVRNSVHALAEKHKLQAEEIING